MSGLTVYDVYKFLDNIAPFSTALDYDNVGILAGDKSAVVSKIGVCLDITNKTALQARELGCNLIISHHPVIFSAIRTVLSGSPLYSLITGGISAICAHSNLDAAEGGVNDCLCKALNLSEVSSFFDPKTPGKPPIGRIGILADAIEPQDFAAFVKTALNSPDIRYKPSGKKIDRVAVCSGAGSDLIYEAYKNKADAFITSEIKHHEWLEADNIAMTVIDAGHYPTENVIVDGLISTLLKEFGDTKIVKLNESAPYFAL